MPTLEFTDWGLLPQMWNVDYSVGPKCWNRKADVQLVQVLLHYVYLQPYQPPNYPLPTPSLRQRRPVELTDDDNLRPDGIVGPITSRWIRAFQTDTAAHTFAPLKKDGKVDHVALPNAFTTQEMLYTIVALNRTAKERDPIAFEKFILPFGPEKTAAMLLANPYL